MAVKPIPDGYHSVTPHITVNDGNKAIDFYKKAFGAKEVYRMPGPGGKIMHAEIQIGDSMIMLNDEFPEMGGTRSAKSIGESSVTLHVYVPDVDKVFNQAVASGATATMPVSEMFWGDRYGKLRDPFGHNWSIATHKEDVSPEDVMKRAAAEFSSKS
jgi:uncharacterized glyoxalase superfamily protein PhnB